MSILKKILLSILFVLVNCKIVKTYTDNCAPLSVDNIQKITIVIKKNATKSINIKERIEIKEFIISLNNSEVNGPWKGAKWDEITLYYRDQSKKIFFTNGKVFGQGSSGIFYNLSDKYKHYWKE